MAAVGPAVAQSAELIQKLSLEPKKNANDQLQVAKKHYGNQYKSMKGGEIPNTAIPHSGLSVTPLLPDYMDPNMYYLPNGYHPTTYYCGGYEGSIPECVEYPRYLSPDAMEMHPSGMHSPRPEFGPVTPGILNRMYPTSSINRQTNSSFRNGFGSNHHVSRMSGQWSVVSDNEYKARGRSNGYYSNFNDKLDGLSELSRGPRADRLKIQKGTGQPVTHAGKGQGLPTVGDLQDCAIIPDREQYNKADLPETYSDAKFFIIKSYSEDDVHKSIKYNVWASTPNGNKRLDSSYQEGQEKTAKCPVFLFFSVNTSGQFLGVAEMIGPVDFNKKVEHWQQDKWTGCFPVKWHIVKDVPNSILKHIILENNDNKPVTNSRDTQEVKLEQGIQMIKIFKEHVNKTSILDDSGFYDNRQKLMQGRRTKLQQIPKKFIDDKAVDVEEREKDGIDGKSSSQLPVKAVTVLEEEALSNGLAENVNAGLSPKDSNSATEKNTETNGIVNCV